MIGAWRRRIIRDGWVDTGPLDDFVHDEKNGELRF
jgi:hypothetical protein